MSNCKCFTCVNAENKDRLFGYYNGRKDVAELVLRILEQQGITDGSFSDLNPLKEIFANMKYESETAREFIFENQ